MHTQTESKRRATFELKGNIVVIGILLLTAVVGSLFIYLGPKATEKTPGIVHVGVRFKDEGTINFLRYGKKGPEASIEFIEQKTGISAYTFNGLRMGRNLIPIQDIPTGPYIAKVSSNDYAPSEVVVIIKGRMLNPPKDTKLAAGTYVDYNMIGARLSPLTKSTSKEIAP